ncbi:MAG: N-acetylmuramoyl-L-alanine amidase [Clostridiales bacterium]|jgi:N-acetylmuramoyl-L-alanine amidase CwlA|nr:N-acetylmuramoyl-L-alanine amidase [Clostridiales bacterium]
MKIEDRLLTPGVSHGRSGRSMVPKGVVVHYVANPGSSALANRNYFENGSGGAGVSAHYIIGLNGEILRCVPDTERAVHAGKSYGLAWNEMAKTNNSRLIGIECCHPAIDGKFNSHTIDSLVELAADLCKRYKLDPLKDVYRHYDVCGKMCPLYYVNHASDWNVMKNKIKAMYDRIMIST